MLSTLSINANGEVVGGSTKFKPSSLPAPSAEPSRLIFLNPGQQEEQLKKQAASAREASSSYNDIYIDVLKGDLQKLEARCGPNPKPRAKPWESVPHASFLVVVIAGRLSAVTSFPRS